MTPDETTNDLEERYAFRTPSGETVEVEVTRIAIEGAESVTGTFRLLWDEWERVAAAGAFHFDGAGVLLPLEADRSVEVGVRLRSALAEDVPPDTDEVVDRLADPDAGLRATAAWYATEVAQDHHDPEEFDLGEDATVSVGTETEWADRPPGGWTSTTVLDSVTDSLDTQGLSYEVDDEESIVRLEARAGDDGDPDRDRTWSVTIHIDESRRGCLLRSVHPERIPPEGLADAALELLILNRHAERGSFEFDPMNGVVSCRTLVLPDAEQFEEVLSDHLSTMAEVYDRIASVAGDGTGDAGTDRDASDETPEENGDGWYSTDVNAEPSTGQEPGSDDGL